MQVRERVTLSGHLAAFVAGLRYEDLPAEVVARGKSAVLDTVGAALGGVGTDEGDRALAALAICAPGDLCAVWGTTMRSSVPGAALANGTRAHARELDDYGGCGHSGAVVVPAAIAAGEHRRISGKALLAAVVAGYDVAARVMDAAGTYKPHNARGWHSTGTVGSFGAAAAAAKALGLDAAGTGHAIGIAGSFTGGLWAFIRDGAMTKRLHPGKAAENGVLAAYLAEQGFTGPSEILEAPWGGFLSTYDAGPSDPAAVTADLGRRYLIMRSGIKPFACCAAIHAPLGVFQDLLVSHNVSSDQVARVTVRGTAYAVRQLGKHDVETTLDAQMSLPYSFAVALRTGRAGRDEYGEPLLRDPAVRALASRVALVEDPAFTEETPKVVEIETADGRRFTGSQEFPRGHARNPLNAADVEAKFMSLASPVLGARGAARVREIVGGLEAEPSLGALLEAVTPAHTHSRG
ncbi:MAG: MmgE/PrpD family protein [bacterium]